MEDYNLREFQIMSKLTQPLETWLRNYIHFGGQPNDKETWAGLYYAILQDAVKVHVRPGVVNQYLLDLVEYISLWESKTNTTKN